MTTKRTFTTRSGRTVESELSDVDAARICAGLTSKFPRSLARKFERYNLSDEQIAWLHVMAVESQQPQPEPVACDTSGIQELFDNTDSRLRFPKIHLECNLGELANQPVVFAKAGARAQYPGSINVTDGGPYRNNKWFGRIVDGQFEPSRRCPEGIVSFVKAFSKDPARIAAEYGRRTGNCCFCRRALTDERSTQVGYGPICADNFGLPWGATVDEELVVA